MIARVKRLVRSVIPHLYGEPGETRTERIFRRMRIGIVIAACLVTLQSLLLVLGAWRNDRQIERNMGVAAAEVLSAGPRRSTIEFVTPDRVTYRPELGVLYPSELDTGMRIYVEYDKNNPDLVRVQDRNAALAIIPAGSIAVVGWLVAGAALMGLALLRTTAGASGRRHQLVQPVVVVDVDLLLAAEVVNRWRSAGYRIDSEQGPEVVGGHLLDVDVRRSLAVADLVGHLGRHAGLRRHLRHLVVGGSRAAGILVGP